MTIRWNPEDRRERAAFLALALVPGLGPARIRLLQEPFDSPLGALSAPFAFLGSVPGLSGAAVAAVRGADLDASLRVLDQVDAMGAQLLLINDATYPPLLRDIPDPPLALFALGDPALLARPAVAIVGSRDLSPYGVEACRIVADAAVQGGAVVVSGMARGVDAVAHEAALEAGGTTVGVLGNGLGVIYPAAHRRLYESVAAQGVLVTEFAPGERPRIYTFPRRNRVVSGLAGITVVVEAAQASGALITAGTALEQGREVLAVPGPITSPTSVGTNTLIRDGATPFLVPDDLWRLLPATASRPATSERPRIPAPAGG
ncbi:MAG TPA: DNA-processing protein DprA, partial [Gemmatimonadales bacterium]|nr:DNA-processing protein DprA [Gemmatimonadales bacterium]